MEIHTEKAKNVTRFWLLVFIFYFSFPWGRALMSARSGRQRSLLLAWQIAGLPFETDCRFSMSIVNVYGEFLRRLSLVLLSILFA